MTYSMGHFHIVVQKGLESIELVVKRYGIKLVSSRSQQSQRYLPPSRPDPRPIDVISAIPFDRPLGAVDGFKRFLRCGLQFIRDPCKRQLVPPNDLANHVQTLQRRQAG